MGEKKFQLSRHLPAEGLRFFVQHFWIVTWDLRGQEPHWQENLPHPSIHLVLEKGRSQIVGVVKGKFSRRLENKGRVFGVKFKPGAFYPFVKFPISRLTDRVISVTEVFGADGKTLEEADPALEDEGRMIEIAENFIRARLPQRDENVTLINRIFDRIVTDREIVKVDDVASQFNLNKRTLQRLFNQYVGVSPKCVIKRYRLHEVVEQLAGGEVVDWPQLALALGYFDQAHFIKDFKAIVGKSPTEYVNSIVSHDASCPVL